MKYIDPATAIISMRLATNSLFIYFYCQVVHAIQWDMNDKRLKLNIRKTKSSYYFVKRKIIQDYSRLVNNNFNLKFNGDTIEEVPKYSS